MTNHWLSGADHFHLLVDREMKARHLPGNVSRLLFTLNTSVPPEALAHTLANNGFFNEVRGIRPILRWPFLPRFERYWPTGTGIELQHGELVDVWLERALARPLSPTEGALRIDLLPMGPGHVQALITFNHALFDHQGMINVLHGINRGQWEGPMFARPERRPFWAEVRNALVSATHAFAATGPRLASLVNPVNPIQTFYTFLEFSEIETRFIATMAGQNGLSQHLLGTMAAALNNWLRDHGRKVHYLWFSTPHSLRKKGTAGHVIGNAMSFFFFKLTAKDLISAATVREQVQAQLREQVRHQQPQAYASLLRAFRRVPMPLFRAMFKMPSWGKWATFANSDLGNLDRLPSHFLGAEIVGTQHFPPVPSPPGLCFASGLEGGKLRITVGHTTHVMSQTQGHEFGQRLRAMLVQTV